MQDSGGCFCPSGNDGWLEVLEKHSNGRQACVRWIDYFRWFVQTCRPISIAIDENMEW